MKEIKIHKEIMKVWGEIRRRKEARNNRNRRKRK